MNVPYFDPWQWIRDNQESTPGPTSATSATIAAQSDVVGWLDLPADWRVGLAQLRQSSAPRGRTTAEWARLVADAFAVAEKWAATARALGWTAVELFGVNPDGGRRLDRDGLAAALEGRKIVAITAAAATIGTPSSGTLQYFRRERPGSVLIWAATGEAV